MSSQLPSTQAARHSTPSSDDEVLVRVEGVSKKFCRSLKKSLWYGVCDIASELNPFGRNAGKSNEYNYLTTIERHGGREKEQLEVGPKGEGVGRTESKGTESTERAAGGNQRADSGEFLEGHSQAGLQMDSEKLASIRAANASSGSAENSSSAKIGGICGKQSDAPDGAGLRPGEFWAIKDVSFELRRRECLGLIGHNGGGRRRC